MLAGVGEREDAVSYFVLLSLPLPKVTHITYTTPHKSPEREIGERERERHRIKGKKEKDRGGWVSP
jgi:hypothetical protein